MGDDQMKTKRVLISALEAGMISAEDVYTLNDQLVIQKGTKLTERIIARLRFYSVSSIRISLEPEPGQDDLADSLPQTDLSSGYRAQVMSTPEFKQFQSSYSTSTQKLSDTLNHIVSSHSFVTEAELLGPLSETLSQVRTVNNLFDILHCMRDSDDMTYVHSLNVALISISLARWSGMSESDITVLAAAALLHDIGKLLVPKEILEKPGSLTSGEYAVVQTHALLGYNLLKDMNIDDRIKRTVLMHHERCDGSGYPIGMSGNQIDDFAKIVAIADVYDAMSSKRHYRDQICPFSIIRLFEAEGLQKYDPGYILTFLQGIAETYLHNNVLLSDGTTGEIIMINKTDLSRPIVKRENDYVDLSHQRDLSIQSIL